MQDRIRIEGLAIDCIVGVYPHERGTPQPLVVDLELVVDTALAAETERVGASVDYAMVATKVAFLLTSCRFHLLETAAQAIARTLLAPPPRDQPSAPVNALTVRLTKPGALGHGAVPSIEITRSAEWLVLAHESKSFGTVDVLHESRTAGVYRLNVAPGRGIPLHVHRKMRESELVLGDGLHCQGRPVRRGAVFRWPHDVPHRYDNPTDKTVSILCVDAPRFLEDDEIQVLGEPAAITPEAPLFVLEREA